ncbi:Nif3-like dinuclear metal center hexameric protein [Saccharibacillus alkalitolerans]|uniref:GTP cyclohydrolase 1 type 2 homolog n=1 Tax=Saccharibacillus alkalitolerans TaxID=2705290 RepID=A0ABX0F9S8_9BACL|nr:Nif3-like dinuclear metal center hexameric protein [Saccharibacillus alkalitolerans]NGZ76229.1 transcriptional regulator [Saccharibacillus alkalitolerans]
MLSSPTVQDVIDALLAPAEGSLPEPTADKLFCGDPSSPVTGIVTAFMPTLSIIERAAASGANLVIGHEGLFFSHHERDPETPESGIAFAKRRRVEQSGVAVFRCHDGLHRYRPDGIAAGLIEALGWTPYVREHRPEACLLELPSAPLDVIAAQIKRRLGLAYLRVSGDAEASCAKVGVWVGYRGGIHSTVPLIEEHGLDLVVYGEGPEWETPEYAREANRLGRSCGLIVLGHAESEEPGMEALAGRLAEKFPGIPVRHLREEPLFRIV